MTDYRLDLGFNWQATQIGEAAGTATRFRPLQMDLTNLDTHAAAYYNFNTGDRINFRVYNISQVRSGLSVTSFTLSLKNPTTSEPMMDVMPDAPAPGTNWFASPIPEQKSEAFGGWIYPAWQMSTAPPDDGGVIMLKMQASSNPTCELSVAIQVQADVGLETRPFVSDPEMWIDA